MLKKPLQLNLTNNIYRLANSIKLPQKSLSVIDANNVTHVYPKKRILQTIISKQPDHMHALISLGDLLEPLETVKIFTGEHYKSFNKRELLIHSIKHETTNYYMPYFLLAKTLFDDEIILVNGLPRTKADLLLLALDMAPQIGDVYLLLFELYNTNKVLKLANGKEISKMNLLKDVLDKHNDIPEVYYHLSFFIKKGEEFYHKGKLQNKKNMLLIAIHNKPSYWKYYYELANEMDDVETVLLSGEKLSKYKAYLRFVCLVDKAIVEDKNVNKKLAEAYSYIGDKTKGSVNILKKSFDKKALYLKALSLNPRHLDYFNLAGLLSSKEVVKLNGKILSKKDLYLKCVYLNKSFGDAYCGLAECMDDEEKIILWETEMKKKDLFLKSIYLNPNSTRSYVKLGESLREDEEIRFGFENVYFNKKDLFCKAIEQNPSYSRAYSCLADCLNLNEKITIGNQEYSKDQLFFKALELNPCNYRAYGGIGEIVPQNSSILLHNGKFYTKIELLKASLKSNPRAFKDPSYARTLVDIASLLKLNENIKLNNKTFNKTQLIQMSIKLNPDISEPYFVLSNLISDDKSILYVNMKPYTKKQLIQKALELEPNNQKYIEAYKDYCE